jgi:hypothetical protein
MPLNDFYLTTDDRWKRLFRSFEVLRKLETNPSLLADLRVAEHKLRLAYTLENYPEEATK